MVKLWWKLWWILLKILFWNMFWMWSCVFDTEDCSVKYDPYWRVRMEGLLLQSLHLNVLWFDHCCVMIPLVMGRTTLSSAFPESFNRQKEGFKEFGAENANTNGIERQCKHFKMFSLFIFKCLVSLAWVRVGLDQCVPGDWEVILAQDSTAEKRSEVTWQHVHSRWISDRRYDDWVISSIVLHGWWQDCWHCWCAWTILTRSYSMPTNVWWTFVEATFLTGLSSWRAYCHDLQWRFLFSWCSTFSYGKVYCCKHLCWDGNSYRSWLHEWPWHLWFTSLFITKLGGGANLHGPLGAKTNINFHQRFGWLFFVWKVVFHNDLKRCEKMWKKS